MKNHLLNIMVMAAIAMILGASVSAQRRMMANTGIPICSGSHMTLKEAGGEGDMGGKVFVNYVFTNISSFRCNISGFPEFTLMDRTGRAMRGIRVKYDNGFMSGGKPKLITLKPKQTAWFRVFYHSGTGFDLKRPPASSAQVRILTAKTGKSFILRSRLAAYREIEVSSIYEGLPY